MVAGRLARQTAPVRCSLPLVAHPMIERHALKALRAAALAAFALGSGACTKIADTPPTVDMAFRIGSPQRCLACEEVEYRDTRRWGTAPLYLQRRQLLTSADIRDVSLGRDSATGQPTLRFTFKPEARERIQRVTADHVGELAAWVVDGEVIYAANIVSPFSDAMQVTGMDEGEQIRLYETLTRTKNTKHRSADG